MERLALIKFAAVLAFVGTAIATDVRWRRIPNWLTVGGCLAGLAFHGITTGMHGLLFALAGFATGFGFLLVLWLIGGGGGGDVKFMGALGTWLGAKATLATFVLSALYGFLCLIILLGWQALSPAPALTSPEGQSATGKSRSIMKRTIPYAVPAGLAAWTILLAKCFVGG